ncbi:excalibur calcium-binding domain-containing protein [Ectobacillus sp. sgz5001026]
MPQPSQSNVYYANCTAVRQAGKAPLHRRDPVYSNKLDRYDDEIACE